MEYRELGNTGLQVSAIGLGCGMLGSSNTGYAVRMVQRALDLGVTFFDIARGYRDGEVKLGLALEGQRCRAIVSTKTTAKTRDDAWRDIHESLQNLRTDYLDNCHLHGLWPGEDMAQRLGPGGALEALIEARQQGIIRHLGCTSHRSEVLVEAIDRFPFEIILVPMNVVEREPLDQLIPLCQRKGIGVTIMKPLATGLLPAEIALKWLLNQPIASAVPGATTIEEVEANSMVGHRDYSLSAEEEAHFAEYRTALDHVRCRICRLCLPCPQNIPIGELLGTDVMYDHYRTMGRETFRSFAWSRLAVERDLRTRPEKIAAVESCTRCGDCETKCPYGLPVVNLLQSMVPVMKDQVAIYRELLSAPGRLQA